MKTKIFCIFSMDGDGYLQISKIALNPQILNLDTTEEWEIPVIYFTEIDSDVDIIKGSSDGETIDPNWKPYEGKVNVANGWQKDGKFISVDNYDIVPDNWDDADSVVIYKTYKEGELINTETVVEEW